MNFETTGSSYSFTYGYNLAGSLNYEAYPSGRAITEIFRRRKSTQAPSPEPSPAVRPNTSPRPPIGRTD